MLLQITENWRDTIVAMMVILMVCKKSHGRMMNMVTMLVMILVMMIMMVMRAMVDIWS